MKTLLSVGGGVALLTSLFLGTQPAANATDCVPLPSGIVAWWQGEGNAFDLISGTSGVIEPGTTFTNGIVGQCFSFDGVDGCIMNTNTPPLTNIQNSFTIEFWAYPTQGFIFQPEGGGMGIAGQSYAVFPEYGGTTGGAGAGVSVGTNGISVLEHAPYYLPSLLSYTNPINGWTHIAVVYANKQPTLYVNGVNVRTGLTSSMSFVFPGKNLGSSYGSSMGENYIGYGPYKGLLDEVSIYDRALGADEIAAIFNAGSAGKCFTPTPPVITTEPISETNFLGTTAAFNVSASGSAPISYQWTFNGANIAGATNAVLTLTDLQSAQAGDYAVVVSNAAGSTNSAAAMLTVIPTAPCDPPPSGIVDWWKADGNAYDLITGVSGVVEPGTTFAQGMVGQCFNFDGVAGCVLNDDTPPLTNIQNSFTIEFWAYPQGNMTFYQPTPHDLNNGGGLQLAVFPNFGGSGGPAGVGIGVGTNGIAVIEHAYNYLPSLLNYTNFLNGWVHVALVYVNKQPTLYVNGVNVATGITSPRTFVYPSKDFGGSTSSPWNTYGPYKGLLDEISIYNRALTAGEIAGIYAAGSGGKCFTLTPPQITSEPTSCTNALGSTVTFNVTASGTAPLNFQWSFDGTNIDSATNSTLTLTNVQFDEAGDYSVLVSNEEGSTGSVSAVLTVYATPPFITVQPANQAVVVGSAATIAVAATGSAPISYQWSFDGTSILGATNAALNLGNVQFNQAGYYAVQVANVAGETNSVTAELTVNPVPPCDPAPAGIAGWWKGDGNALDSISGSNGVIESGTSFTNGMVGQCFSFDGVSGCVLNDNTPPLTNIQNSFTIEFWAYPKGDMTFYQPTPNDLNNGGGLQLAVFPNFGGGGGPAGVGIGVGTNGIAVIEHADNYLPSLLNYTNFLNGWVHIGLVYSNKEPMLYVNGAKVATGITSPRTFVYPSKDFGGSDSFPWSAYGPYKGLLDEISIYNRALNSNEIAAIYTAGSAGKCPAPPFISGQPMSQTNLAGATISFSVTAAGIGPFAYQWSFDGTNISDATNATLTLSNIEPSEAGIYSVLVSDVAGATNSIDANLTVVTPPVITQQPENLTVLSYNPATFSVAATGTGPLTYQWQLNGTNLVDNGNVFGSATASLTIQNANVSYAGNYQAVVTSPYASTNSAIAVLTIPQTAIWLGSTSAMSGTTITVPVMMNALGVENTFVGSISYDPQKLVLDHMELGLAVADAYFQEVDLQTNNGNVGFAILLNIGSTFVAGTQEVADVIFHTQPVTNNCAVNLTFGDTPTPRQVVDNYLNQLPAIYQGGTVQLTPAEYCGDVYPRFNGDHQLTLEDWLQEGRFVAGLDVPTNSDEFLRADCAPRGAPDGELTVADWVQVGRYALGLDPLTIVTAPPNGSDTSKAKPRGGAAPVRILQVGTVSAQRGKTVSVPVSLVCITNENAMGMTLSYNTSQLRLLSFSLGSAFSGGRFNVNSNQLGEVGLVLAASPGATLPAGTNQIAVLNFAANANASGTADIALNNSVVKLQTADLLANPLATTYVNGAVTLPPQPSLSATVSGGQLQFNWSLAAGTFQVQTASQPTGPWTTVALPLTTNGANVNCALSATNQQQFFRLLGQ